MIDEEKASVAISGRSSHKMTGLVKYVIILILKSLQINFRTWQGKKRGFLEAMLVVQESYNLLMSSGCFLTCVRVELFEHDLALRFSILEQVV